MPFNLKLSAVLRKAGWKVKIYDGERIETPHLTIICKTNTWRMSLRTGDFLFPGGNRSDLPDELLQAIKEPANWEEMRQHWDAQYGKDNPVEGQRDI